MSRKGINNDNIIAAAVELVEEKGFYNLSLRELAGKLNVQPSSLYNHVKGIEEIINLVGMYGIRQLEEALIGASMNKSVKDSIYDMAVAYRDYAKNNPELYQAIIELQRTNNEVLKKELYRIIHPFTRVIEKQVEDNRIVIHLQRFIRSTLHGFVCLEKEGYMTHCDISIEDSFHFMVGEFIRLMEAKGEKS